MISNDGASLVKYFEGCELTAYKDTGGIPTIGYGHTKGVTLNEVITQEMADDYLMKDLVNAEVRATNYVAFWNILPQNKKDAIISQAYNIRSFPMLIHHLTNGSEEEYLSKILLYCKDSRGNTLEGLYKRRMAEKLMYEGDTWEQIKDIMHL